MKKPETQVPPGQFADDGSVDSDFLNMLAAEAIQYIHADATEEIVNVLTNTSNTSEAIGATAYKITKGLLDRHKPEAISLEADLSHAIALGTEVTDMLVEVVQAAQPEAIMDPDKVREEALLRATVMHGEEVEAKGDPDAKEEAGVMYATMMQDGTVDQAFQYVDKRSAELGLNTNDTMRAGIELGTGYTSGLLEKNPLAKGIEQGTQNMAKMGKTPEDAAPPPEQGPPPEEPNAPLMPQGGM